MNKLERVCPWTTSMANEGRYDLLIASLGYERRSRFVAESEKFQSDQKCAIGFGNCKVHSYRSNQRWFSQHGFNVTESSDSEFKSVISNALAVRRSDLSPPAKICVDISSMSRLRIACVLSEIVRMGSPVAVDFVYSVAKYLPPVREMSQIESAGPVLDEFAGWSSEPQRPASAIFGLGYEHDKAIGALDYIEPAEMWAFQAVSADRRYDHATERANQFLWGELPREKKLTYHVSNPFDTFMDIESLTYGVSRHFRPVLIPFGPKIFTLCCLLVALVHKPTVAVWRVSSGENETPVDRVSDGTILGLRVGFSPATMDLVSRGSAPAESPVSERTTDVDPSGVPTAASTTAGNVTVNLG
jgi:hypothetical protein